MFILAISPIFVILILMVGFRWKASRAGGLGYLTALLIAWIRFGINLDTLVYAHAKAVFLIMDVLLIIWTAFLLYRVVAEAGGTGIFTFERGSDPFSGTYLGGHIWLSGRFL